MGFGGISIWQLLIILLIVVMLFGTKKLSAFGADLGNAIKGFRKAVNNDDNATHHELQRNNPSGTEKTRKEHN